MDTILTKYTVYHVDGTETEYEIDFPREPGYNRLAPIIQPHLDGADLERVYVLWNDEPLDMFVDEFGAGKPLPRNEKATEIYRNNVLTRRKDKNPEELPAIYGPAVLFHRRVWF